MAEELYYKCPECEKEVKITKGGEIPECCGKPMGQIPLEQCTLTETAEHARTRADDEPCDDGRAGINR